MYPKAKNAKDGSTFCEIIVKPSKILPEAVELSPNFVTLIATNLQNRRLWKSTIQPSNNNKQTFE